MALCLFCKKEITHKNYRNIFTGLSHVHDVISDIAGVNVKDYNIDSWGKLGLSPLSCRECCNKVNRLSRINSDITDYINTKLKKLQTDKQALKEALQFNLRQKTWSTPKHRSTEKKRALERTPTPRKLVKRALLRTPAKYDSAGLPQIQARQSMPSASPDDAILCRPLFHPVTCTSDKQIQVGSSQIEEAGTVKISIQYASQRRVKIVKDPFEKKLVAALSTTVTPEKLSGILYKDEEHRKVLHGLVCHRLSNECSDLCSDTAKSCLRQTSSDSLCKLSWDEIIAEWQERAPLLHDVLLAITSKVDAQLKEDATTLPRHLPYMALAGSVLLFNRNPKMCRLQTAIGLLLDFGGATDETLSIMQRMGITLTPQGLYKKKKGLLHKHEELLKDVVGTFITQRQDLVSAKNYLSNPTNSTGDLMVYSTTSPRISARIAEKPSNLSAAVISPRNSNENETISAQTCDNIPDYSNEAASIRVDSTTIARPEVGKAYSTKLISRVQKEWVPSIEALGDNFDMMVSPSSMTLERQRLSWHWFLLLVSQKRITDPSLPDTSAKADIHSLPLAAWLPNSDDLRQYENDLDLHVADILVNYISFLQPHAKCLPQYIPHPYVKESRQASTVLNVELIDAPENSSNGIIKILKRIDEVLLPKINIMGNRQSVERVVLGGDVLTNERAFSGQDALLNAEDQSDACGGILHRPEGLHRQMNFLMGIYQEFYKEPVSGDRGIPYGLRNVINRRDVTGPKAVTKAYRSHEAFIDDCLDAYVLVVACSHFQLENISDQPNDNILVDLRKHENSKEDMRVWLFRQASAIRKQLLEPQKESLANVQQQAHTLDDQHSRLKAMYNSQLDKYKCVHCGKMYRRPKTFIQHLQTHDEDYSASATGPIPNHTAPNAVVASFCRMALLYRDTKDAYMMADGNRIFRNAKLELLYAFALGHTKYRQWLWRTLAYEQALLSPREAFEYKWNCTVNLKGGLKHNIPNDNAVELQVGKIKKRLQQEGSNKSFASAQNICKTMLILEMIKDNMMKINNCKPSSTHRPVVSKLCDIKEIIKEVKEAKIFEDSTESNTFIGYQDPLARIDMSQFHKWIKEQKDIAAVTLVKNAHL